MSNTDTAPLFPLVLGGTPDVPIPPSLATFMSALNNLNDRLVTVENSKVDVIGDGTVFSAGDRAVLDEVAGFFGVHRVVANTLATKAADPSADIDPNTGLPRVVPDRPAPNQISSGFSQQTMGMPGA